MDVRPVTHPSADALKAFGLGKMDDSSAEALMEHLESCADCRKAVAALSGDDFLARVREVHDRRSSLPPLSRSGAARSLKPGLVSPPSPAPRSNLPPELADHPQYEILRELGRGGMGVVYLARNKLLDRLEVLKVVNRALLDRPGAAERFLREIRSVAKLEPHSNVVMAYSALQAGESLVFAMQYVEGEDLARFVKARSTLPVPFACYCIHQAALGLQYAFEKGLVHRDIKPQNLMLSREGKKYVVKVLDFGLAKAVREGDEQRELTGEGRMLGTPDYMAPEQACDAAHADVRADVYSLGCTLYYLLTGAPPFPGDNLYQILHAHQSVEARPLTQVRPNVPAELAAVVAKMLAKDPAQRYQTPIEVARAVAPFIREGAKRQPSSPDDSAQGAIHPGGGAAPGASAGDPMSSFAWETLGERSTTSIVSRRSAISGKPEGTARRPRGRSKGLLGAAVAGCTLLVVLMTLWAAGVFKVKTREGTLLIEVNEPGAEVFLDGEKATVTWGKGGRKAEVRVKPGTRKVEVRKSGFSAYGEEVTVEEGGRRILVARLARVTVPPNPVGAARLTGKQPAPAAGRVAELQRGVRDAMKTELASGQPADLSRAAKSFLDRASSLEYPDERFALLDLARDLAARAGDLPRALETCARLDKEFLCDALAVKIRTLQQLARSGVPADAKGQLLDTVLTTGFEALAADRYGPARDAANLAAEQAPPEQPGYAYQARFLADEVTRTESASARLSPGAKAATGVGADPAVNTECGLFAGFVKNDWDRAVEFLRAGGERWRVIAEREQKHPATAADRMALGDIWWRAGDSLPPADAVGARRRARHWYLGALGAMKSAERAEAARRLQPLIDRVARTPVTLRVRMAGLSGYHWLRISSDGVRTSGRGGRKITGDIQVNHLHWTDHVAGHRNYGSRRLLPDGIDFSTAQLVRMSHGRWGAVHLAATPEYVELTFWHMPSNLKSDFDLTLTFESSGFDLPSRFGPQWDIAYYNWPEKRPPFADADREALFQTEPADRVKLDTINFVSESSPLDAWHPGAPPSKKVGADRFALVGTSTWHLPAGRYRVQSWADDGVRVLIDGQVALDNWRTKGRDAHATSGELRLKAGAHHIRIEYYQITASAILQFDLVRLGD